MDDTNGFSLSLSADQLDKMLAGVGQECDLDIGGLEIGRCMLTQVDTYPDGTGRAFFTYCDPAMSSEEAREVIDRIAHQEKSNGD